MISQYCIYHECIHAHIKLCGRNENISELVVIARVSAHFQL